MLTSLRHQEAERSCCFKEKKLQKERGRETWPRSRGTGELSKSSLTHPWAKPLVLPLWLLTKSVIHCKRVSEGERGKSLTKTTGSWRVAEHSLLLDGCPQPLCLQRTAHVSAWWSSCGVAYAGSLFYGLYYFYIFLKKISVTWKNLPLL